MRTGTGLGGKERRLKKPSSGPKKTNKSLINVLNCGGQRGTEKRTGWEKKKQG